MGRGDPSTFRTGLLVMDKTALTLGGLLPIALKPVYRQDDDRLRAFRVAAPARTTCS